MTKANAYGHGTQHVANAVQSEVDGFGVATVEEAINVKSAIQERKDIFLSSYEVEEIECIVAENFVPTVWQKWQIENLNEISKKFAKKTKINFKIDSGMNRLGAKENLVELLDCLNDAKNLQIYQCYSHMRSVNNLQPFEFEKKKNVVENFCLQKKIEMPKFHLESSNIVLNKSLNYDFARIGISAYGYGDSDKLIPAMKIKSKIVETKKLQCGEFVGYGNFAVDENCNVAVVFGGYADGINRKSKFVQVRNCLCEIVCVCMDLTIIKTPFECALFEDVWFLNEKLNAEVLAKNLGTISYEILTSFDTARTNKIYIGDKNDKKRTKTNGKIQSCHNG